MHAELLAPHSTLISWEGSMCYIHVRAVRRNFLMQIKRQLNIKSLQLSVILIYHWPLCTHLLWYHCNNSLICVSCFSPLFLFQNTALMKIWRCFCHWLPSSLFWLFLFLSHILEKFWYFHMMEATGWTWEYLLKSSICRDTMWQWFGMQTAGTSVKRLHVTM